MFELILTIVAATCSIIAAFAAIRALLKGPHITFSLTKAEISLYNQEHEESITLLMASVANKKKSYFGDVAKKVSGMYSTGPLLMTMKSGLTP